MPTLSPATYIDSSAALDAAVQRLLRERRIACDTESNSLHAYRSRTCLIQFSTAQEDMLVDPLALPDLRALGAVFADPAIEITFHAAEYDLICLKQDFDFEVRNVFDTMAAARVCGIKRVGLAHMLQSRLGIYHAKKHQTANWARRPLSASRRHYAQMDTHYLLPLRDSLCTELQALSRLEEAQEYFVDVQRFQLPVQDFDPEGYWSLFRPRELTPQQVAILRELYILRDQLASALDQPAQRLIPKKTLLQIVKLTPSHRRQLAGLPNLPRWLLRRHGQEIIEAVQHGLQSRPPSPPPRTQATPEPVAQRYSALYSWRRETARARALESDVIISKSTLWEIARRKPKRLADLKGIPGLGPWRRGEYGAALLGVIHGRG